MKHDPEKAAAWYLAGRLSPRKRGAFEAHMLECEDCWQEVEAGRSGRAIAESARDLAPQPLRERVRATIAAMDPGPRRSIQRKMAVVSLAAVALVGAVGAAIALRGPSQPQEIELAVATFEHAGHIGPEVSTYMPKEVDGFELVRAEAGMMGHMEVIAHTYSDDDGNVVVVYRSDRTFPIAKGASHAAGALTWIAEHDGAVLFCSDRPAPTLVVGGAEEQVTGMADALHLR